MTKKEVKKFLDSHRFLEYSAAKLEYSKFLYPGFEELVNDPEKNYISMRKRWK